MKNNYELIQPVKRLIANLGEMPEDVGLEVLNRLELLDAKKDFSKLSEQEMDKLTEMVHNEVLANRMSKESKESKGEDKPKKYGKVDLEK